MKAFLLLGQSNMVGMGEIGTVDEIEDERIFVLRNADWEKMKEPVNEESGAGVGLGASFALEFVNKYDESVGLIPCAVGGTSISKWQKGEKLYCNAVAKARQIGVSDKIIGILWLQGETDSRIEDTAKNYEQLFMNIISSLKAELDLEDIPVIMGEIGEFYYESELYKYSRLINKTINKIVKENENFGIVSSKGLLEKGDKLHFDAPSLRVLGKRFFEAFKNITLNRKEL